MTKELFFSIRSTYTSVHLKSFVDGLLAVTRLRKEPLVEKEDTTLYLSD